MCKRLAIYDFDGTLVDSSHRYKTTLCEDGIERIDLAYWIANEKLTMGDTLLPLMETFYNDCKNPEVIVVIATARIWCDLTVEFCERYSINPDYIIARQDRSDTRGGAQLKLQGLEFVTKTHKPETIEVYEDNLQYLATMCKALNAVGHFFPSNQGH
jgi:beta-phosphoglucomutase-like phosphatase (HAD superfamily)